MIFSLLADAGAAAGNQLLVVQALDAFTTRVAVIGGAMEANPLQRPFVRTNIGIAATVLVENAVIRVLFHRSPIVMRGLSVTEAAAAANNVRTIIQQEAQH